MTPPTQPKKVMIYECTKGGRAEAIRMFHDRNWDHKELVSDETNYPQCLSKADTEMKEGIQGVF